MPAAAAGCDPAAALVAGVVAGGEEMLSANIFLLPVISSSLPETLSPAVRRYSPDCPLPPAHQSGAIPNSLEPVRSPRHHRRSRQCADRRDCRELSARGMTHAHWTRIRLTAIPARSQTGS